MLNILSKIWRNKIFVVFVILILITFPSTFYLQSDKDKTLVTSSIGIDMKDNEYEVTVLAVIPKGSEDVSSNLEVFSANGKTISDCLDTIGLDLGKKIGLAHCDTIIFSKEIMQNNLSEVLDYFTRTANLSTNPSIISTPKSAKELLEAIKSSNNLLDLSLKNIIMAQEEKTLLENTTLDRFYRAYLSPNSTFAIPLLSVKSADSDGGEGEGGGSGSSSNMSAESGGNKSNSGAESEKKKIENKSEIAIVQDGKYLTELNEDEKFIYSLVTKPSKYQKFVIDEVNDNNFIESTLVFQEVDKLIIPRYKFVNDKPVVEYNIWLPIMIDEARSTKNYSFSSVSGVHDYLTPIVKEKIINMINEKLEKTIERMQTEKYDVLNLYEKFEAFRYRKFEKYLETLESPRDYMSGISIDINITLSYVI